MSDSVSEVPVPRDALEGKPFWLSAVVTLIAVVLVTFHLWTAATRPLDALQQRSFHLGFGLALVFLLYPAAKGLQSRMWLFGDFVLAGVSGFLGLYPYFEAPNLAQRVGTVTPVEEWMLAALIVLILEASRRTLGWTIPIIAMVFLAYTFFGEYSPILPHANFTLGQVAYFMYLSPGGIYGSALGVSATILIMFLLLASIFQESGSGRFLVSVSNLITGSVRGGAAKVAVVASGGMGSLTGSPLSNVVGTGSFTIPIMKSIGYRREFAGAVEAAASTGGVLLPPVMGTAAFLMADFLQVPYSTVVAAAVIPAILYFVSVFVIVDLEAARLSLRGVDERPSLKEVAASGWFLILPWSVLVYLLVISQINPMKAAYWALLTAIGVSILSRSGSLVSPRGFKALRRGAIDASAIIPLVAASGIIEGLLNTTGLGISLARFLVDTAGESLLILSLLSMTAAFVLGLALPSAGAYVLLALLVAPAMITFGVGPLAAHFFLFFFAASAGLTPPIAITSWVAAGIAGADAWKTSWWSVRMVLPSFLIAYAFLRSPALLGEGSGPEIVWMVATSLVGVTAWAAAVVGHWLQPASAVERGLWAIGGGVALVTVIPTFTIAGMLILIVGMVLHVVRFRQGKRVEDPGVV